MSPEIKFKTKKIVLGFDETNNGAHLKCFNKHHDSLMIVTGYLEEDLPMKGYQRHPSEAKGKIFNGNRNLQRALERGKSFLEDNPHFLYTPIPPQIKETIPLILTYAESVACICINFFLKYNLNPLETRVVMDEVSGEIPSRLMNEVLESWLEKAELPLPHRSMRSAASNVRAVKKADMVGYYLTAIHLQGNNHKWPYQMHKVSFGSIRKSIVDLQKRTERYPII